MDLINFIIDAESISSTCFLCFKLCDNGTSIYDVVDMQDKSTDFTVKTTILNVIKFLFPSHDIIFSKACIDCVGDLKKIYCKLQWRNMKIESLRNLVDMFNRNIPERISHSQKRIKIPLLEKHKLAENVKVKQKSRKSHKKNIITENIFDEHARLQSLSLKDKSESVICDICGKRCENPKALRAHLNSHNEKACPYCLKVLKTHAHFNKHVKSHTMNVKRKRKIKHYYCSSCPYKTINKRDLDSHNNKAHLKIRPYQCENCPKSFYKKSNLTDHLFTHDKSRRFVCELCGSDFSVKKSLIQHLMLHEGKRDYECRFCKRRFVSQSRKNEHIKRSHSNKCHKCLYCSKKFALLKNMNTHLNKDHWDVLSTDQNFLLTDCL